MVHSKSKGGGGPTAAQKRRAFTADVLTNSKCVGHPPHVVAQILKDRDRQLKAGLKRDRAKLKSKKNVRICNIFSSPKYRLLIHACSNQTTSNTASPGSVGYTYVPVGTPALSNRCEELSKQLNVPFFKVDVRQMHS